MYSIHSTKREKQSRNSVIQHVYNVKIMKTSQWSLVGARTSPTQVIIVVTKPKPTLNTTPKINIDQIATRSHCGRDGRHFKAATAGKMYLKTQETKAPKLSIDTPTNDVFLFLKNDHFSAVWRLQCFYYCFKWTRVFRSKFILFCPNSMVSSIFEAVRYDASPVFSDSNP